MQVAGANSRSVPILIKIDAPFAVFQQLQLSQHRFRFLNACIIFTVHPISLKTRPSLSVLRKMNVRIGVSLVCTSLCVSCA